MEKQTNLFFTTLCCLLFCSPAAMAAPYLEFTGVNCGDTNHHKIVNWNGRKAFAFSSDAYDFSIECNGSTRRIIDLFLSTANADRYQKRGGTLYKHTRDERKQVMVRDEQCHTVYEDDYCARTPDQLFQICRGDQLCEIEHSAYRCQRPRQRCRRAEYETRYEPVWEPFPVGHAPLPNGARIIEVAERQTATVPVTQPRPPSSGDGFRAGLLLLLICVGGFAFYWFNRKPKPAPSWQYSAGGGPRFEDVFEDVGDGFEDRSSARQDEPRFEEPEDEELEPAPDPDDIPRSRAEALALLNIDENTAPDVAKEIYRAMVKAWHESKITNEADRERYEKKMKQLNVAKDYIFGKR